MMSNKKLVLIAIATSVILVSAGLLVTNGLRANDASAIGPEVRISVEGSVNHILNLTSSDIENTTHVTVTSELICVDRHSYGTHEWTGIRLSALLDEAGVLPSAVKVGFHASDGYTTDLTLPDAMRKDVIIAFEMDGVALKEKTRLVVPGMWGYKWISGLDRIVLYDFDFRGTYESKGYPDNATISA